jgi:hypothetical protein
MLTIDELLAKVPEKVLSQFDFSKAVYHGALKPVTGIVCPDHGEFKQYPAQLRKAGSLCPSCGDVVRRTKLRSTQEEFLIAARRAHGERFTYDRAVYRRNTEKVTVTCRQHGDFPISPQNLYAGKGCPVCANSTRGRRLDPQSSVRAAATRIASYAFSFEQNARKIHGDAYDYSTVNYDGMKKKVIITCRKHGPFEQTPGHHLKRKHGCPRCSHHLSRAEDDIAKFVSIFTPIIQRDRSVVRPKELDIYIPEKKVAIEYCGMYWHSHANMAEEKEGRLRHFEKHQECLRAGVRLLTIYETEWRDRRRQMMRLIRNVLGVSRGKLMARKCDLERISSAEAAAFFDCWHPQGGSGYGQHWGLRWKGKLVACMRFTYGANDRGSAAAGRDWTLTRYASRVTVAGGASRLFRAFVNEIQPDCVKSFSDNRLFEGKMYEAIGFRLAAEIEPDYMVWSQKLGLRPKSHYQRRNLQDRLSQHGVNEVFDYQTDPRTESEVTYLMGARRIYDCGKRRWVWNAVQTNSSQTL